MTEPTSLLLNPETTPEFLAIKKRASMALLG
jgi:hypothetical protein